jgi:hypothetical protein
MDGHGMYWHNGITGIMLLLLVEKPIKIESVLFFKQW